MDYAELIEKALQIIGIASAIAAITPTPTDNVILGVIRQILNVMAANVGQAKPEKKPALPKRGPRG